MWFNCMECALSLRICVAELFEHLKLSCRRSYDGVLSYGVIGHSVQEDKYRTLLHAV